MVNECHFSTYQKSLGQYIFQSMKKFPVDRPEEFFSRSNVRGQLDPLCQAKSLFTIIDLTQERKEWRRDKGKPVFDFNEGSGVASVKWSAVHWIKGYIYGPGSQGDRGDDPPLLYERSALPAKSARLFTAALTYALSYIIFFSSPFHSDVSPRLFSPPTFGPRANLAKKWFSFPFGQKQERKNRR